MRFWDAYPRKTDKRKAFKAWQRQSTARPPTQTILEILEQHKRKNSNWKEGIIPHPTTWINGHRWEDEIIKPKKKTSPDFSEENRNRRRIELIALRDEEAENDIPNQARIEKLETEIRALA